MIVAQARHHPDRLAIAAATRQLVATDCVEPAVGPEHQQLVGRLGMKRETEAVALFELERR